MKPIYLFLQTVFVIENESDEAARKAAAPVAAVQVLEAEVQHGRVRAAKAV